MRIKILTPLKIKVDVHAEDRGEHIDYKFYYGVKEDVLNPARVMNILGMSQEMQGRLGSEIDDMLQELFGGRHFPEGEIILNLRDDS